MIKVYGASDDLIEIEGDITEEFNPPEDECSYLAFSDGTVLSVVYDDDGVWRINRVEPGRAAYKKTNSTGKKSDYSDRVELDGEILWCVFGSRLERK